MHQATPLIAGLSVAAAALAGRYGIQAWQAFKARPPTARMRKFYEGGFQPKMTRREAALILGVRCVLSFLFKVWWDCHCLITECFKNVKTLIICVDWEIYCRFDGYVH